MSKTKKLVFFAVMVSLASALHAVEMLIPNPLPFPGAKLGLANTVSLLTLAVYGLKEGIIVSILRVILGSLIAGTFLGLTFMLSMSGAVASTLVMAFLLRYVKGLSIVGVSVVGAVTHNISQLFMVSFVIKTTAIFYYLPFLLLVALPTGAATGLIVRSVKRHPTIMRSFGKPS